MFSVRWLIAPSRPSSSSSQVHLSSLPVMPITRQPCSFAICAATLPVAPAAAETTTVSPSATLATSTMPM